MSISRALGRKEADVITCTVHEPPDPPADRMDRADSLVFVKEGLTYAAAAFTPLWLVARQQWLALVLYLVVLVLVLGGLTLLEAPPIWLLLASSALHLLVGFEADTVQRWTLARRGYRMIGTVTARSEHECERRFIESWLPQQPMISASMGAGGSNRGTLSEAAENLVGATTGSSEGTRGWLGFARRR
jgi:hypothetical protein